MPVPERRRRCAAAQPRSQNRGYISTALLRRRCKAGNRLAIPSERQRGIADRKDIGESGNRKIKTDLDATSAIRLDSEPRRGRRCNHSGRPQDRTGLDAFAIHDDPAAIDLFNPTVDMHLDAQRFQ